MKLTRIGANRKEVQALAYENQLPIISVDAGNGVVSLLVKDANGMGAQGRYNYTVELSAEDLMQILNKLSLSRAIFSEGPFQSGLEKTAAALLRLLASSTAIPFQLAPSRAQLLLQKMKEKKSPGNG